METGVIDSIETKADLLLGWDGMRLQWLLAQNLEVLDWGLFEAEDGSNLEASMNSLNKRITEGVGRVTYTTIRPVFTLCPAQLAKGNEQAIMALHLGGSRKSWSTYYSHSFGDEMAMLEAEDEGLEQAVLSHWPFAKRKSSALAWLEKSAIMSSNDEVKVLIDCSSERSMMARIENGQLTWSMTSFDTEGDGILYHVVNALHRDGMNPESSNVRVEFSGSVSEGASLMESFKRFFPHVTLAFPDCSWKSTPPKDLVQWTLLSRLLPCE